jgi:replication factor A1
VRYSFTQISRLIDAQKDAIVDIIGVVKDCHEVQHLVSKTSQRQLTKRDVTLVDQSNSSVKLTMWGQLAEQFDGTGNPVLACKAVRVSDYQGEKSLSTVGSSQLAMNPDIPESHSLRGWFDGVGRSVTPQPISVGSGAAGGRGAGDVRRVLGQIEGDHLGQGDKVSIIILFELC